MQTLRIILLCVICCVVYGVVHDQITARICVEYFTIGHPPIFGTEDPTLLGLGWGVLATWWVGVVLGVPLAMAARLGKWPKRSARLLIRPVLMVMACSALMAVLAGIAGYLAATNGWVWLIPPLSERVPEDRHTAFLVDLWAHGASYLAGFIGGLVVVALVLLSRQRAHLLVQAKTS